MVWYVRDAEVRKVLSEDECNQMIEDLFRDEAKGHIVNRPTVELPLRGRGVLRLKAGGTFNMNSYGYKAYPAGGRYLIFVYDLDTGLDGIVEGRQLTELRTGAVSAVGTKFMARPDASTVGIIGTGREARQQLASIARVRRLRKVWAYSRSAENRAAFAREMSERLGIEVISVDSGEECVRDADVVTTITSASEPVLEGAWLREGTHINAVGGTTPNRRELDDEAVGRCGTIAVELLEGARHEVGELIHAVAQGRLSWDKVCEMKDIVSGAVRGRQDAGEITLFDTVGVGAEDVALATHVLRRARSAGIGIELGFEPPYNVRAEVRPRA